MKKNSGDVRGFVALALIALTVVICIACYSEYAARKREIDGRTEVIMLKPEATNVTELHVDSEDFGEFKNLIDKLKDKLNEE